MGIKLSAYPSIRPWLPILEDKQRSWPTSGMICRYTASKRMTVWSSPSMDVTHCRNLLMNFQIAKFEARRKTSSNVFKICYVPPAHIAVPAHFCKRISAGSRHTGQLRTAKLLIYFLLSANHLHFLLTDKNRPRLPQSKYLCVWIDLSGWKWLL